MSMSLATREQQDEVTMDEGIAEYAALWRAIRLSTAQLERRAKALTDSPRLYRFLLRKCESECDALSKSLAKEFGLDIKNRALLHPDASRPKLSSERWLRMLVSVISWIYWRNAHRTIEQRTEGVAAERLSEVALMAYVDSIDFLPVLAAGLTRLSGDSDPRKSQLGTMAVVFLAGWAKASLSGRNRRILRAMGALSKELPGAALLAAQGWEPGRDQWSQDAKALLRKIAREVEERGSNRREISYDQSWPTDEYMPDLDALTPEERVVAKEDDEFWYLLAEAGLSEQQAIITALEFLDDYNDQEIADLLGVQVGTVKSQKHRSRNKLLDILLCPDCRPHFRRRRVVKTVESAVKMGFHPPVVATWGDEN